MKKYYTNPKKIKSVEIIKHYDDGTSDDVTSPYYNPKGYSTITKDHYTHENEHPEDRIFKDREYIQRLQRHIDDVYELLKHDLRLQTDVDWLFDYIFNEDDKNMEFEEYLAKYDVRYDELVK